MRPAAPIPATPVLARLLAGALLFAAAPAAAAPRGADPFDPVRDVARQALRDEQVPSIAVAVARDGKVIWEEAFGWADREHRIAATPHTLYSLASVTKPLTATGLMVLQERGLVDLDRPINDYLGTAKVRVRVGDPARATVRRVAGHTAGLPAHHQFFYEDEPRRTPSRDETILRYGNAVFPPGERYAYSNLGYGILDHVIARVSGRPYADFMRGEVFLPLGLTHTSIDLPAALRDQAAVRYGEDGLPLPMYGFDHPGGSAAWSSAHDLVRFAMFHLGTPLPEQKAVLRPATLQAMRQPAGPSGYAVGWSTGKTPRGRPTVDHGGGMPGVSTWLGLYPGERLAVVVLSNSANGAVGRVADAVVAALLPDERHPDEPERPEPEPPPFQAPAELVGTWSGAVHTPAAAVAFTLVIPAAGDVQVKLGDQPRTLLDGAHLEDGLLGGELLGDLGSEEGGPAPCHLLVALRPQGNGLAGAVTALSASGAGGRTRSALSHWAELRRVPVPPGS
jgi:CubicO group peptidase (beta-lactamase class C family)